VKVPKNFAKSYVAGDRSIHTEHGTVGVSFHQYTIAAKSAQREKSAHGRLGRHHRDHRSDPENAVPQASPQWNFAVISTLHMPFYGNSLAM
jgi:hypothetical protein